MKKIILAGLIVIGFFTNGMTQTVNLTCENTLGSVSSTTNNRNYDIANCWGFGGVTYAESVNRIDGRYSTLSGAASNMTPTSFWIKSPWLKPGTGNITIKTKLSATSSSARYLTLAYVPYDAAGTSPMEGTRVDFYTYTFSTTSNSVITISQPIPAAIANSNQPYKIIALMYGNGGSARIITDTWVIPGTYWANPSNSCLPLALIVDADNDGVQDSDDAYPNDAARAYNNYYPSANTYGTLMFEDLWPTIGDYDFNDLVLAYRYNRVTDAANKVVEVKATYITKAVGATLHNGFGLQLNGVTSSKVTSVTGAQSNGVNWLTLSGNGTESGQTYANIIVFDDALRIMPNRGGSCINTISGNPYVTPDTTNLTISLTTASGQALSISDIVFNPYLIISQTRNKEVHLANFAPTDKASSEYFGTGQDNTTSASSSYKSKASNLPWALDVPATTPYMKERVDFISGYLNFANWAISNGTSNADWYLDNTGNRDNSKIY